MRLTGTGLSVGRAIGKLAAATTPLTAAEALVGGPTDQLAVVPAGMVEGGEMVCAHVSIMKVRAPAHIGRSTYSRAPTYVDRPHEGWVCGIHSPIAGPTQRSTAAIASALVPTWRVLDSTRNPAQLVVIAFTLLIAAGTILLALPAAADGPGRLALPDALFMSTSAATVTGLATIEMTELSLFGELVLLGLIQLGGFGIMTIGAVIVLVTMRRVGLRQRMLARAEIGAVSLGEIGTLVRSIAAFTVVVEATVATVLLIRFVRDDAETTAGAAYSAVFHAVSAFNNAGVSLHPDSLERYVGDPLLVAVMSVAFIIGGLGFPVLLELRHRHRPRRWGLHTRLTLAATAALLVIGPATVLALEWNNVRTLGELALGDKLLTGWFQGTTPRTAGFTMVPIGEMHESTLLFVTTLMFIGAGPASTSGGIKVTTFAVLAFVLWSEVRGHRDVHVMGRRLPDRIVRQAITVALLAVGLVIGVALALVTIAEVGLSPALFEAASAFGTVGLSTGITADLPTAGQMLLVLTMLAGRVGVVTFVTALALRPRQRTYRYPEEQPIIG